MPFNPVDFKQQDLIPSVPGQVISSINGSARFTLKAADIAAKIKGGRVATVTAANEVGACTASTTPIGLFFGDASKSENEVSIYQNGGLYEILAAGWYNGTDASTGYTVGKLLVSDANGFLKPRNSGTPEDFSLCVAVVTKQPTSNTDSLCVKLLV